MSSSRWRPALAVALLAACGGRYAPAPRCPPPPPSSASSSPRVSLEDSDRLPVAGAPLLGARDAPVTVVVFSDFQCPYCARARVVLGDLRAMYRGRLRVVWRNYPLPGHPDARLAAEAAMEAFAQGGDNLFWRFHDVLFAHGSRLGREDLERYAALVGMDLPRLRAALDEHTHRPRVDEDIALGEHLAVDGTPAFFVNGTALVGAQSIDVFEQLVTAVLARAAQIADPGQVYAAMVREPLPPPVPRDPRDDWTRTYPVTAPAGAPSRGGAAAPVVIQVFSDFQCGFCARVEPTLAELVSLYGDRVRLVWRDHPLPGHPRAMPAAEAAREAFAQRGNEGFWRYHDLLFQHQAEPGGLDADALEDYAREVGLDLSRFRAALVAHVHGPVIRADLAAAESTQLRMGTPSFLINGHFFSGARPLAEFRARIDGLLGQR